MKIYVDYDDCLCETAKAFSVLAERLFGKIVPYEEVRFFNLQASFGLSNEEYEHLMLEGHRPEEILSYEATPGAAEVVNEWVDQGHEVTIITGRPFSSYEPSRKWLDMNGFDRVKMYCLNKYGRDTFIKNSDFNMELEDYYKMKFDFAVEDSPMAFRFFEHLPELRVLVYDRPWNQEEAFPNANYSRVRSWEQIRYAVYTRQGDRMV